MKNRRGASLVELLLIMSACTVVLTLSAELIHRVMIAQSKATTFLNAERSAQRLTAAFRRDVHAATERREGEEAKPASGQLLALTLPDDRLVEYRLEQGTITRTLSENDATKAREQFVFPAEATASVASDDSGMITLTIDTPIAAPSPDDATPKSQAFIIPAKVQIQAILGGDARIETMTTSGEDSP